MPHAPPPAPAAPGKPAAPTLRFGAFELRPEERRLLRDGQPVALGARAIDLLVALASQRGRLLSKQQLLDTVWPDVVVEEANLHVQMSALRKVLGPELIATVPGRGYQFVAPLLGEPGEAAAVLGSEATSEATSVAMTAVTGSGAQPAMLPPLIGREAELAALDAGLESHALLTLVGSGGVGKTALARHCAERWRTRRRHGVVWVDLLAVDAAAGLTGLTGPVAAALALKPRAATPQALAQAAASLDLLLVLDNGEHLAAPLAALCDALLAGAPQLRLLVTSQVPLQLFGEHVLRLGGLAVPPGDCTPPQALQHGAVALFAACARQADRRFVLDDDSLPDVLAICRALDGSALGLQVAAALLARMPLAAVRQGLGQRLAWPELRREDAAAGRHLGLRSALQWSLGLLDAAPRELFRRMAAFTGPADAALLQQALAGTVSGGPARDDEALDPYALVDALAVLVDRSLVAVDASEPPRYQLLETPRALADELLAWRGDAAQWRERVYRAVAARAAAWLDQRWLRSGTLRVNNYLTPPLPDLAAAFAWAHTHNPEHAVSLGTLLPLTPTASAWAAHAAVMQQLAVSPGLPVQQQARAWLTACAHLLLARPSEAQALAERAAVAYAAAGDALGEYSALCTLADIVSTPAAVAQAALQRAQALEDPAWGPQVLLRRFRAEGAVAGLQADWPRAITALRRAAALAQAAGELNPAVLISLANAELASGQAEAAARHLLAVIEQLRDGRHDIALFGFAMPNLVAAALARGHTGQARRTATEGWPQAVRVGAEAWWADHLALLAALEGRHRTAASLLGLADAAYAAAADQRQPLETQHAERAEALARQALGAAAFTSLRAAAAHAAAAPALRLTALSVDDLPG